MDPALPNFINENWPIAGLLVYFIMAIQKEWWVLGTHHKRAIAELKEAIAEVKADRDEWKAAALRNYDLANSAVKVAGGSE